jgi:hypothetical protein
MTYGPSLASPPFVGPDLQLLEANAIEFQAERSGIALFLLFSSHLGRCGAGGRQTMQICKDVPFVFAFPSFIVHLGQASALTA